MLKDTLQIGQVIQEVTHEVTKHPRKDQVAINKLNKKMVVQMTKMPRLMIQSCHDVRTYLQTSRK